MDDIPHPFLLSRSLMGTELSQRLRSYNQAQVGIALLSSSQGQLQPILTLQCWIPKLDF